MRASGPFGHARRGCSRRLRPPAGARDRRQPASDARSRGGRRATVPASAGSVRSSSVGDEVSGCSPDSVAGETDPAGSSSRSSMVSTLPPEECSVVSAELGSQLGLRLVLGSRHPRAPTRAEGCYPRMGRIDNAYFHSAVRAGTSQQPQPVAGWAPSPGMTEIHALDHQEQCAVIVPPGLGRPCPRAAARTSTRRSRGSGR